MNRSLLLGRVALPIVAAGMWAFFIASTRAAALQGPVDFAVYYDSGRALLNQTSPYIAEARQHSPFPFHYPPIFALLALPIALLSFEDACLTWYILSASMLLAGLVIAGRLLGSIWPHRQGTATLFAALVILAAGFYPIWVDCKLGQVGALVFCLAAGSLLALQRKHETPGGCLLGLALILKPIPVLLIPFALRLGKRRYAAVACGVYLAAQSIALILAPQLTAEYWLRVVPLIGDNVADSNLSLIRMAQQPAAPYEAAAMLIWLCAGVLVGAPFVLARQADDVRERALLFGMVICASACILPMVQSHYMVWLLLPLGGLLLDTVTERFSLAAGLLIIAFGLLSQPYRLLRLFSTLTGIALPAESLGGLVLETGVLALYLGLLTAFEHHRQQHSTYRGVFVWQHR